MKMRSEKVFVRAAYLLALLMLVLCLGTANAAPKPTKPVLNAKVRTLQVGSDGPVSTLQLTMTNDDANSPAQKAWSSSNPDVASVDASGLVTPLTKGSATITLTITENGQSAKASCAVTVKPVVPSSVRFDEPRSVVGTGSQFSLNPTILPANAYNKKLTFKSSNPAVATVTAQGEVTANKPGKATISCVTASGKKKASMALVVVRDFSGVKYRFFGIGNANYPGDSKLNGCKTDLNLMKAAFQSASYSGRKPEINAKLNLNGSGIRNFLSQMAQGAGKNDVTVFYYSGHGMSGGKYSGALCGIDWNLVTVEEVRKALDKVPGKVIVLLDCCLSGQYITSRGAGTADAAAFNRAVRNAFSSDVSVSDKALTDSPKKDKYKILTASGPKQSSFVSRDKGGARSVFTEYLAAGLGIELEGGTVALAADKNKDSVVTLNELFGYVDKHVRAYVKRNPSSAQTTMIWPQGDAFAVLARS